MNIKYYKYVPSYKHPTYKACLYKIDLDRCLKSGNKKSYKICHCFYIKNDGTIEKNANNTLYIPLKVSPWKSNEITEEEYFIHAI